MVQTDPASVIAQAWHETGRAMGVMAATLLVLCVLVYAALARLLRPTQVIRAGLERLAADDLSTRLPHFDLAELSAISDVFNKLAARLDMTLAERNELMRRLITVQDEERRHLARELHDEFGQSLTAISALAASVKQTAEVDCPPLVPEADSIARITARMMQAVRGVLVRLRPPDLDELGLAASLESLVAGWNSRSRMRFGIEFDGDFDRVPPAVSAGLYRIAQEAITNAARHAEASLVVVRLQQRETDLVPSVEDDGTARPAVKSGMGLLGMRERAEALGGMLSLENRQPGLVLRVLVPLPAPAHQPDAACAA